MMDAETNRCVLLIDDQEDLLEVFSLLLEKKGYEVFSVSTVSGALALWNLHKRKICAVISDTWLSPTESTTELLSTFKHEMPDTPIIVTSGYLAEVDATTQLDRRTINYLPKPFDHITMFEALAVLTGRVE